MNQTATQPLTTLDLLTDTQASTNIHFFSDLPPLETSTIPTFTELLAEYQATVSKPQVAWSFLGNNASAEPFAISQTNLAKALSQPVRWLWQKRLPLAGLTLLDGDHGCGKSLLALHIAACVSSGTPLPDGSPTLTGGVVIVSPHNDATTTQLLTTLGADLTRVEILSTVQQPAPSSHTEGSRPFSIPEDLPRLFQAINRVDARLVIFDPFISLLSHERRWTDQRLDHLLADLKLHLIEHNVACLITRNCHARGGHARPSVLERSDHFEILAASRLLLAPDPLQPDRLLLSHVTSRHAALTPTLTLQIQPSSSNPDLPHITILGSHSVTAKDLINYRPDTLHRRLLSQHLLQIIIAALDPIPVASLYALSPHSSAFQIQRSLSDLLHMGQIERPTRSFYIPAPTAPVPSFNSAAATTPIVQPANNLDCGAATTLIVQPTRNLDCGAATTLIVQPANNLDCGAVTTPIVQPANNLDCAAATTPIVQPANNLDCAAATTPIVQPANNLDCGAATTPIVQPANNLDCAAATTPIVQPANNLDCGAATTPIVQPANNLDCAAATTPIVQPANNLDCAAATTPVTQPANNLDCDAATTPIVQPTRNLDCGAATTPMTQPANNLNHAAATTPIVQPTRNLDCAAAITPLTQPSKNLNTTAATTPIVQPANNLNHAAATTLKPKAPKRPHKQGRAKQRNTKKRR